jgi:plastocyanin
MKRSHHIVAVMLAVAMSACGGSSDVTTPSSGGQGSNPPPPAGTTKVTIQDFSYAPAAVTIKVGSTVQWTNKGPSAHTTVSDAGVWNSGVLTSPGGNDPYGGGGSAGGSFSFTFTQAGTYTYHCSLHPPSSFPGFTGTVTVTP